MKILIFTTAYLPFVGGAELAIKEITDRIGSPSSPFQRGSTESARGRGSAGGSEGGVSFTLITARFKRSLPAHEHIGKVEVYRVGHGCRLDKWLLPFRALRLAKQLEHSSNSQTNREVSLTVGSGGFDVIWSMMASQASVAAAWFKKAFPEKKLVLTLQEGDEEEHLKRYVFGIDFLYRLLIRPWHLLVFKQADAITAISNYLVERARRNLPRRQAGNPSVPVVVIPNGVDITKFQITNSKSQTNSKSKIQNTELRKKLGFADTDQIVITTSRLVEKNGVGDLIEALRYLPEHVKLLICGSGPLETNFKLKTSNVQLANRVRFVGHIPHEQLPPYLWASDVFCRPSRSEGMGTSFVEAMAAGLPVVATPVGGILDFLISPSSSPPARGGVSPSSATGWWEQDAERITGLFCRVGDPRDIAEKIKLLLSNDELRNRIVANASKMVREKYEWEGVVQKMKKVFEFDR